MNFLVTVRLVDRQDSEQPDPFFLGPDAEWTSVELMLNSMYNYSDVSSEKLDVRYWDDEDFVILSSQDELDEACRLAQEKGILQLYVRSHGSDNIPWPDQNTEPSAVDPAPPSPRERPPKRTAEEAFTPDETQSGSAVDPSVHAVVSLQVSQTSAKYTPGQESSAAAAEEELTHEREEGGDMASAAGVGASDPGHKMVPGASSGANVIAIEMPECPMEVVPDDDEVDQQGTEAAEPAEMAETGEVAPKSGRDAETGFWMMPKDEKKAKKASVSHASSAKKAHKDARPKEAKKASVSHASSAKKAHKDARPKEHRVKKESRAEEVAAVCVSHSAKLAKPASSSEKSLKKKKQQQADALTQEIFLDYMMKYQSELRRDIVKDVTRKTVRQVVEGISKLHLESPRNSGAESGENSTSDLRPKWPVSIHDRIICDHCDQMILGSRYKCGNCTNYDLCEPCESLYPPVHNTTHVFIKLRRPCAKAGIRHGVRAPLLKRPLYEAKAEEAAVTDDKKKDKAELERLIQIADRLKVKEAKVKEKLAKKQEKLERKKVALGLEGPLNGSPFGTLCAEFVRDVTIPDGSIVVPGEVLEKTWLMRNNGTMNWPRDTVLREVRGNMSAKNVSVPVGLLLPGQTTQITVVFCAPEETGDYESHWRLYSSSGLEFGHYVFIKVHVGSKIFSFDPDFLEGGLPSKLSRKEKKDKKQKKPAILEECKEEDSAVTGAAQESMPAPLSAEDLQLMSGAHPSPAVPSTPTNTPFAASPSGRCASPSPKEEDIPEALLVPTSTSHSQTPAEDEERDNKAEADQQETPQHYLEERITCYQWLKEQAAVIREEDREEEEEERGGQQTEPLTTQFDSFQQLPLLQLVPSAPLYHPEGLEEAESVSTAAQHGSEEEYPLNLSDPTDTVQERSEDRGEEEGDADSCPELLDADGFVMCPAQRVPSEQAEADADSTDDDLYTSAYSPKALALEMPTVGASPVMTKEDVEPAEVLTVEVGGEGEGARHSREMSPSSTTSSVEVVSVADLDDFDKEEGEEEYRSIDTHGAWLSPSHMQPIPPVADLEREAAEGYEILPDDLSSMSDESSIDDDFCIVIPDCFDMSKPLNRDSSSLRMEKLSDMCLKTMESQGGEASTHSQSCRQHSQETAEAAEKPEAEEEDSTPEAEKELTESSLDFCAGEAFAPATERPESEAESLRGGESAESIVRQHSQHFFEVLSKEDIPMTLLSDYVKTKTQEQEEEEKEEEEEEEEEEEVKEEEEEAEEDQQTEREEGKTDGQEHTDDTPAQETQPAADVTEEEEETEAKTQAQDTTQGAGEEGEAAAAPTSPTVVDMIDPGQHLNQLMQSTMKAASTGLQHLYKTTKDVFKTLQAETYECKESSYEFKPSNYTPPTSTWKPSNNQYTPPRNDFKPPKSDFQMPKSTYTGPKSQSNESSDEFAAPLERIREMGYFNNERSIALLKKYKGDVHRVVDELLQESDNDWATQRH